MKYIIMTISVLTTLLLTACKKNNTSIADPPAMADIEVSFNNLADSVPVVLNSLSYTNKAMNRYSINQLKYYISNLELVSNNGHRFRAGNYTLVDIAAPAQNKLLLRNVPAGNYTGIVFGVGVDSVRNHTGVQDGFLDPSYGMIWTWNTGYIFFKHEGQYLDSTGSAKPLRLHLGNDKAYTTVTLPVNIVVTSSAKKVSVNLNMNAVYGANEVIDFNTDNDRQSTNSDDDAWIAKMKMNLVNAFSILVTQ